MMQCPIYGRRLLPGAAILVDAGFDLQASPSGNPLYFCLHMAVQRVGFAASSGLSESVRPGRGFQPALYTLSASFLPSFLPSFPFWVGLATAWASQPGLFRVLGAACATLPDI